MKIGVFGLYDLSWPWRSDLRSCSPLSLKSLSNFIFIALPWKTPSSVISNLLNLRMASFDLGGHWGWPLVAINLRALKNAYHAKFQLSSMNSMDFYWRHTEVRTEPDFKIFIGVKWILASWSLKSLRSLKWVTFCRAEPEWYRLYINCRHNIEIFRILSFFIKKVNLVLIITLSWK